jgi:hypothetical protein
MAPPHPHLVRARRLLLRGLGWHWLLAALSFYAYHRALIALDAEPFPEPHRSVAPLFAQWAPQWPGAWLAPPLAAVALLFFSVRWLLEPRWPPMRVVGLALVHFFVVGLSVSMIDGLREYRGRVEPGFVRPVARHHWEYFGDAPLVERMGPREFVHRYSQRRLFSKLAVHSKSHPPGPVLFHWLVGRIFGYGWWTAALATIVVGGLTVPLLYALGRDVYGDAIARRGLLIWLVTPNVMLLTVTGMDGVFAAFGTLSLWLFARWRRSGSLVAALALGISLGAGTFMTYSMVFLPVGMTIITLLDAPRDWRRRAHTAGAAAAGFVSFHLVLVVGLGHQALASLRTSMSHAAALMGTGRETLGRYLELSTAQVMVFLIGLGVAVSVVWLRGIADAVRESRGRRPIDAFALGTALTLALMAFSSLYSMEVERVWLFMVPPVALVGARHLWTLEERWGTRAALWATIAASAAQLLAAEVVLDTLW